MDSGLASKVTPLRKDPRGLGWISRDGLHLLYNERQLSKVGQKWTALDMSKRPHDLPHPLHAINIRYASKARLKDLVKEIEKGPNFKVRPLRGRSKTKPLSDSLRKRLGAGSRYLQRKQWRSACGHFTFSCDPRKDNKWRVAQLYGKYPGSGRDTEYDRFYTWKAMHCLDRPFDTLQEAAARLEEAIRLNNPSELIFHLRG